MKKVKLKYRYYDWKANRRYKKFEKCSLPFPFIDRKRDTFEWVYHDKPRYGGYDVHTSIYEALSRISSTGVSYHYKAYMYGRKKPNQKECKYQMMESHCHSFDDIIRALYMYPETFQIPKKYLEEYSKQELECLKTMQSYLNIIGLKDEVKSAELEELDQKWDLINNKKNKSLFDRLFLLTYSMKWNKIREKNMLERYNNERASLYSSYYPLYTEKKGMAEAYLNGTKDYVLERKYSFSKYSRIGRKYLLVNSDNKYCGALEVISEEEIAFKDLNEEMVNYKLAGFKSFKEYKKHLYDDYKDRGKIIEEEFTENSILIYLKVKVLEKF